MDEAAGPRRGEEEPRTLETRSCEGAPGRLGSLARGRIHGRQEFSARRRFSRRFSYFPGAPVKTRLREPSRPAAVHRRRFPSIRLVMTCGRRILNFRLATIRGRRVLSFRPAMTCGRRSPCFRRLIRGILEPAGPSRPWRRWKPPWPRKTGRGFPQII